MTTIDDFMRDHQIRAFDFVKIDTEGHDLDVLQGGTRALDSSSISLLKIEATFSAKNSRQVHFCEILKFLEPLRYRYIGTLPCRTLSDRPERNAFADVMFAHDSLLRKHASWSNPWQ